jgi:hypothetical protein
LQTSSETTACVNLAHIYASLRGYINHLTHYNRLNEIAVTQCLGPNFIIGIYQWSLISNFFSSYFMQSCLIKSPKIDVNTMIFIWTLNFLGWLPCILFSIFSCSFFFTVCSGLEFSRDASVGLVISFGLY